MKFTASNVFKIGKGIEKLYSDENVTLFWGDVFECLNYLPENEIQCIVTSPTYWGKRNFTDDTREFGSETLEEYVEKNTNLYASILNLMKKEGSLFTVMQDSYMGSGVSRAHHNHWEHNINPSYRRNGTDSEKQGNTSSVTAHHKIIKNKSLSGIPYRIAIKLVDRGFIWREHIIWEKPNPMPENISDRVRQSAEYIFHFTKEGKYKFNPKSMMVRGQNGKFRLDNQVWLMSTEPKENHTATFPSKVVRRLLLATSDEGDTVFEPFLGSGTMLDLCLEYKRNFIGCDINREFVLEAAKRVKKFKKQLSF